MRFQKLISQIVQNPESPYVGEIANELAAEFWSTRYSPEELIPLLTSGNPDIAGVGTFVAHELGENATPLVPCIKSILRRELANESPDYSIVADCRDTLLNCMSSADIDMFQLFFNELSGRPRNVAKAAVYFFELCDDQLLALWASSRVVTPNLDSVSWLLDSSACDPESIKDVYKNKPGVWRRIALVAALRCLNRGVSEPLRFLCSHGEPFDSDIACKQLSNL